MKEIIMRTTLAGPGGVISAGKRGRMSNRFANHLIAIGAAELAPPRKRKELPPPEVADPEDLEDMLEKVAQAEEKTAKAARESKSLRGKLKDVTARAEKAEAELDGETTSLPKSEDKAPVKK